LALHNEVREERLVPAEDLMELAQEHTDWMHKSGKLRHQPLLNLQLKGYRRVGENIARGDSAEQVFRLWTRSLGHRTNITSPRYRYVGIGRAGRYWCVCFGGQRKE